MAHSSAFSFPLFEMPKDSDFMALSFSFVARNTVWDQHLRARRVNGQW